MKHLLSVLWLMGIGRDCFYWVRFDLLQTLFRLVPQGPRNQGMGTNLNQYRLGKDKFYLKITYIM